MSNIVSISHQKLEIKHILDKLSSITVLPEVKRMIDSMMPSNDIDVLNKDLDDADEALRIVTRFERAPIMLDSDFRAILSLALKGAKLSALEIYEVEKLLEIQIPEGEYDTLSGYLVEQLGAIPKDKEKHTVETEKVTYYIEKCQDKRIITVKACKNNEL